MRPDRADKEDLAEDWTRVVAWLQRDPRFRDNALAAGLFAALALEISADSRGFSNDFGLSHALVLREVVVLDDELGLIAVTREDPRTQRRFLGLTPAGQTLAATARAEA
ncbi:hypothetical protein [Falsirhodobacter halotolerans]|uniref:hypothetical protein n=1 Tax=Falsirhodobacter halotolerans TaxID=1146892 RepID=UPI001FD2F5AD|nr:hypothetical protein [Falsirhodobacter halotolerans]MCJ8138301.1 hypothetical protein [Falsirhodobacter halotolerans]